MSRESERAVEALADGDPVLRRKRALYRAQHRGTKEMDWMVGRYAEARLGAMAEIRLLTFEKFLEVGDPTLNIWLFEPAKCGEAEFKELIEDIRDFNSLG